MDKDDRLKQAEELYHRLSPQERRERLFLSSAYRTLYNELIDAADLVSVPRYLYRKWLPALGPTALMLYLVLREESRIGTRAGEAWCWPKQEELGKKLGINDKTTRKYLKLLEAHGFIQREAQFIRRQGENYKQRATDFYVIFLDVPLAPEDAVEMLLREVTEPPRDEMQPTTDISKMPQWLREFTERIPSLVAAHDGTSYRNERETETKAPHGGKDYRLHDGKKDRGSAFPGRNLPSYVNVSNDTNLPNVRGGALRGKSGTATLRRHPLVEQMPNEERERRSVLAIEIGETLDRMAGKRDSGLHKSLGLHRRLAFLMPETCVREALAATRDAVEEQRAGRKTLGGSIAGYFAGIAFAVAEREGIDLGVNRSKTTESQAGR